MENVRSEIQITHGAGGRILTNTGVWSPDSRWIVYDTRSDRDGTRFDGTSIEMVDIYSGEVRRLYRSQNGAHCGVAIFDPVQHQAGQYRVVFILGPENPTPDWEYGPSHRQGALITTDTSTTVTPLDARDLTPPFTPGALRGGSHVHVFSPDGQWVSFTYNDHILERFAQATPHNDVDQRNVGISVPGGVVVPKTHSRNHDGTYYSVLVTRTVSNPRPGSDEIQRAFEEGWVGKAGYSRADGSQQRRALAFQGEVLTADGQPISEVFIVDLPNDPTAPGEGALQGTDLRRPAPPRGTVQRRLTHTESRKYPGIQGLRHWMRSSADGTKIAFLMRDDSGVVQVWAVSPNGGDPTQITRFKWDITSAFSWSPDGRHIACIADRSVFVTEVATGHSERLTPRSSDPDAPLPLACVYSPDRRWIAYQRTQQDRFSPLKPDTASSSRSNQIFVVPALT